MTNRIAWVPHFWSPYLLVKCWFWKVQIGSLFIQIPFVVAQNHPSSSITSHLNVCQSSIGFAVEGFDWLVQPQKLLIWKSCMFHHLPSQDRAPKTKLPSKFLKMTLTMVMFMVDINYLPMALWALWSKVYDRYKLQSVGFTQFINS